MTIDEQLLADCHLLGTLEQASVLLNRNASVGWLILVPETRAIDWHQLDDAEHARVSAQIRRLTAFAFVYFEGHKMNVATLGNQVAQMHIHVIARRRDDPCWPRPVWGQLDIQRDYSNGELAALRTALTSEIGLVAGGSA